jgi:phospholipid/cholesterol/gamma-HCH transport system permease protein
MSETDASFSISVTGKSAVMAFTGQLNAPAAGQLWRDAVSAARRARGLPLTLDLGAVSGVDLAGAALLAATERAHGVPATLTGAAEHVRDLLARAREAAAVPPPVQLQRLSLHEMLRTGLMAAVGGFAFLGEVLVAAARLPARRRMQRWGDLMRQIDQAGVKAVPLVLLLGFLMGTVLAFQSAIPMQKFGAIIFVASLVSVSLTRELGPLLAGVILAGRTASAFAAEIGTMKVNEEIDALTTMGLDPVTMLVLPRLAAGVLVMPAMTLVLNCAGIVGMAVVMKGFGYSFGLVESQVQYWTTPADLYGGLVKAACFGAVISAIGCRSGLSTGVGPRAVGLSATAAVVGGIVAIIMIDGVFALFFNRLGL